MGRFTASSSSPFSNYSKYLFHSVIIFLGSVISAASLDLRLLLRIWWQNELISLFWNISLICSLYFLFFSLHISIVFFRILLNFGVIFIVIGWKPLLSRPLLFRFYFSLLVLSPNPFNALFLYRCFDLFQFLVYLQTLLVPPVLYVYHLFVFVLYFFYLLLLYFVLFLVAFFLTFFYVVALLFTT